jgi:hypothetical protein
VIVRFVVVGRVGVCMVCTYVIEERGDGEGVSSDTVSFLSYILNYIESPRERSSSLFSAE